LIAEQFKSTRGLALSIVGSAPAIAGAAIAPIVSAFIDDHGWRAGYIVLAIGTFVFGIGALLLIPRQSPNSVKRPKAAGHSTMQEYSMIVRSSSFQSLFAGALFCNLSQVVQTVQLTVLLLERGLTSASASFMVSIYAVSLVVGRFLGGIALDRFTPRTVMVFVLASPAVGLLILASGSASPALIGFSVMLFGMAVGSKINAFPFLVMHYFKFEIYGTVLGLIFAVLAFSAAAGSLLLSLVLKLGGDFSLFLNLAAAGAVLGSVLFLFLGRTRACTADVENAAA
jgi:predicted MFS family arabinose efflux permease